MPRVMLLVAEGCGNICKLWYTSFKISKQECPT